MDKKEYIERGALLKRFAELHDGGNWLVNDYNADWIHSFIETAHAADVVSKGVYEQVQWERDMAMQQLEEHGIPFCGVADDVVNVVRCKDCIHSVQLLDRLMCKRTAHKSENGWFGLRATADKHFCSYGERKEQT